MPSYYFIFLGIWFLQLSHKKSTHKHAFCLQDFSRLHIRSALFCFSVLPLRLAVRFELIEYNRKGRYRMQYLPFLHLINFSEFQHRLLNMDCRFQRIFLHPLSLRKPDRPAVFKYRDSKLFCCFIDMALSENINLFTAVRTFQITEVLHNAKYRNVHHICHVVSFFTIICTNSCGDVTITMPSTGSDWNTVSGTSPVPGGISTNR